MLTQSKKRRLSDEKQHPEEKLINLQAYEEWKQLQRQKVLPGSLHKFNAFT